MNFAFAAGSAILWVSRGGTLTSTSPLELCFMSCRSSLSSGTIACLRAGVAQLVEQLICNQPVGGSNPFASPTFRGRGLPDLDKRMTFGR